MVRHNRNYLRWFWRRLSQLSMREHSLLAEAVLWLILARLALAFVPFQVLAAWFGALKQPDEDTEIVELSPTVQSQARKVGWAVTRAARHVPFRAVCLPQAIAAKAMLNRRGIENVMHFGVGHMEQKLAAHAWLDAGGVEITGHPVAPQFVEMARFH